MTKQYYLIDSYTTLACVVGTTISMELPELEDYAKEMGWELEEIPVPDYYTDDMEVY